MSLRPDMEVKDYAAIVLRRRWLVLYAFLLLMAGSGAYCIVAPELFRSSTTILIVPQRVPENYVRSTVSARPEERLAAIQQQVMSRTQLTSVIEELGLNRGGRKGQGLDETIDLVRRRIELQVRREEGGAVDSRGGAAIKLSFVHEDRRMAMLVASRLASVIIDENLKTRELQASGTAEFLDSQLAAVKEQLAVQEERVKQYKMSFMGELPQQLEANLQMLRGLQEQFRANSEEIRAREDRRVFIEAQMGELERMLTVREPVPSQDNGPVEAYVVESPNADPAAPLLAELAARKARLADLTARYTDRYPEVPRARKEVEAIERRIEEARRNAPAAHRDNAVHRPSSPRPVVPVAVSPQEGRIREELGRLKAQAVANASEVTSLRTERAQIQRGMADLEQKVGKMPKREQEMIALTRDYENLKRSYNELLQKKLDADVSQNLEKRQKGEQFQVLDPANLPDRPFRPDRARILGVAFLLSCVIGIGAPILLEALDPTVHDAKDLRHLLDLPVIASMPVLQDEAAQAAHRAGRLLRLAGALLIVAGFLALAALKLDRLRAILNV